MKLASVIVRDWCERVDVRYQVIPYGLGLIDSTRFMHTAWRRKLAPHSFAKGKLTPSAGASSTA